MKALVKYAPGNGNLQIMEVAEPECGSNQVKIEVAYCGVCGTDIHVLHDTFRNFPPVILGHEFSGTVVEIGKDVTGVRLGERIAGLGATAVTCGHCEYCRSGYFIFCTSRRGMGHGVNGAFARYVVLRPDQLYRIPANFSMEEAAMSEPFAAAVQAVTEVASVKIGDTVLISGPGPIGLLCLKLLVAQGVKTIVVGAPGDDARLQAALDYGASAIVDLGRETLKEAISEHTGGEGVNVAFECAGVGASVHGCLESLKPMGQHIQVAICGREIQFPIDQIFYKQLKMSGSVCYTAKTWDRMMKIFAGGQISLTDMISSKVGITEWQTAFDLCTTKKAIKVLMYPE